MYHLAKGLYLLATSKEGETQPGLVSSRLVSPLHG